MNEPGSPLHDLASAAGVMIDWIDAWGDPMKVADDDLRAVLSALLGRPVGTEREVADALDELRAVEAAVEPVTVAWDGVVPFIPVAIPIGDAEIGLEDGSVFPARISEGGIRVEDVLPIGYHVLRINGGDITAHVFSAPTVAHPAPSGVLGLVSPTYSLRVREADHGIGTVHSLRALAELCMEAGIEVVGTLPLLAAFPEHPSPYAPASRRAWNELFVDFAEIPDFRGELPMLVDGDRSWVDYERTGERIRSALAEYARHVTANPTLRSAVDSFLRRDPEMRAYARFRAIADERGTNWRAWPQGATADPLRLAYHETAQWLMDAQLRRLSSDLEERGQFLYMDLPIGCHADGFDVFDAPDLYAPASLGAPPDTLFVGGQDWGLPASIPNRSRQDGHASFRKAINRQLTAAGLLRIDHVMGIHRTWWVPHGAAATQGAYVMQPTDEMFAIICIESVRAGAGVIGENLGTVPPEIREGMAEHQLMGMAMATDGVSAPRPNELVALTSHDTPSFPAWWNAMDVEDLEDLGVFDAERAANERQRRVQDVAALQERFGTAGIEGTRDALMTWMAGTDAAVALLNLDDLVMEERRQNIPGTYKERPNWSLRHAVAIDDLADDPGFMGRLAGFRAARGSGEDRAAYS